MNRSDFSRIAHAGTAIMNPISPAKLDELIGVLDLPTGARVLDLACGKGELLVRIAERYSIQAVGVDLDAALLVQARAAIGRAHGSAIEFFTGDMLAWEDDPESFDLAATVGASVGGYEATLRRLRGFTRPGGLVLLGDGYWPGHRLRTISTLSVRARTS